MSELKPCICGKYLYYEKTSLGIDAHCTNKKCALYGKQFEWLNVEAWNTRPLEDALRAELTAKDAEIERLRAVIRKAEWVTEDGDSQPFCTGCGASFIKGHDGDCPFCQWEGER